VNTLIAISAAFGLSIAMFALAQSQSLDFKAIKMKNLDEQVTGIICSSAKSCAISTSAFGGGHIYTSDTRAITGSAVDGSDKTVTEKVSLFGTLDFYGFDKIGERIMVRAKTSSAFITAKGDVGQVSNWSVGSIGTTPGGLNQQMGIGTKDHRWVLFLQAFVAESINPPDSKTSWTTIWSPDRVPEDFNKMWQNDKTLCSSIPGVPRAGIKLQSAYVAPDLSILAYTTSEGTRDEPEGVGICLSNDGGKRFYRANLNLKEGNDPNGVTCISSDTCFTFSDRLFNGDTDYIYYTNDAQKLGTSTWTLAKLPTMREKTTINSIFFAPDRKNGWAVGGVANSSPLLLSTTDGGATWKDSSSSVRAVASDTVLHSGFALDANNVWLGGKDVLLTTSK
jgi:hypothetical protein